MTFTPKQTAMAFASLVLSQAVLAIVFLVELLAVAFGSKVAVGSVAWLTFGVFLSVALGTFLFAAGRSACRRVLETVPAAGTEI